MLLPLLNLVLLFALSALFVRYRSQIRHFRSIISWSRLLISAVVGFFLSAFVAGILESIFPDTKIEFESLLVWMMIVLYVSICYITLTAISANRQQKQVQNEIYPQTYSGITQEDIDRDNVQTTAPNQDFVAHQQERHIPNDPHSPHRPFEG